MKAAIANFARNEKSLNASSLVVVIMTHGDAGGLCGVDGCKIHPETDVLLNFNRDSAPNLVEKPKLFLFQACRGCCRGNRIPIGSMQDRSAAQHAHCERHTSRLVISCSEIHFLEFPLKGYVAWRDVDEGSWLISDFCRIVRSKAREEHVLDIITEVRGHACSIFALYTFLFFNSGQSRVK
ncbi:hypothetical protein CAPTEDRAFT_147699 [Capitella teleta]|uniref:Caspase family p20 domain-containing protein n=1 Tax=Capitella teleta TaxID=283909 RepID=R7VHQ2_CAPTE|nr:hypothetical protein CAPTEDRAFT_147699 [Capitella teleta]|eukprot:ELU18144.1 hypothetical protein CAPTEDRAFT_147699 [Capitella teleta]